MPTRLLAVLALVGASLISACSEAPENAAVANQAVAERAGVDWFEGDIDQAFALASEQGKPLFLYWGAEWCPYCKLLQANIFIRDEFVRLSRQFVPVDMSNGDSTTIRYADEFKIYGLPTVIVFSPEGRELTRIPGGMDMEQYASVLALTLNQVSPVAELVAAALAGSELSIDDWKLLANYAWTQDRGQALGEDSPESVLLALRDAAPGDDAAIPARLGLSALAVWLAQPVAERDPGLAAAHLALVDSVLTDPALAKDNLMLLAAIGGDIVALDDGPQQRTRQRALLDLFAPVVADGDANLLNRASVLSAWAEVATAPEDAKPVPADQVRWAQAQADAMLAALDNYQVHAGVNSLWPVYYDLGLETAARDALEVGMARSSAPFYFMSTMAYIERQAGNNAAAVDWYRRAWEATSNPLDRVRWGSSYLQRLTTLAPDDVDEIGRAGGALLADLLAQPGGLDAYSRTLARVSDALRVWAADSPARLSVLARLRQPVETACGATPEGVTQPPPCSAFALVPAQTSSAG